MSQRLGPSIGQRRQKWDPEGWLEKAAWLVAGKYLLKQIDQEEGTGVSPPGAADR